MAAIVDTPPVPTASYYSSPYGAPPINHGTLNGYTCPSCGGWVLQGSMHLCGGQWHGYLCVGCGFWVPQGQEHVCLGKPPYPMDSYCPDCGARKPWGLLHECAKLTVVIPDRAGPNFDC